MPSFNRERASIILVDALYSDDELAAEKHGITARTIRNYRGRLDSDQELSKLFCNKRRERERSWAGDMPAKISSVVKKKRELIQELSKIGKKNNKPTMLYLIREDWRGLVKVGISNNITNRLTYLQSACPQRLNIVAICPSDNARKDEAKLHARFEQKRINGEWFRLNDDDIDRIKSEWEENSQRNNGRSHMNSPRTLMQLKLQKE